MGYPSILHGPNGAKRFVKDEGEMLDAYNSGFKDSPADFTPEAIKAEKERLAAKKIEDEIIAKAKVRAEKAEALLVKTEKEEESKKKLKK